MRLPDWLSSSWAKVLGAIGVYGTLAGLGLLPVPAAAAAVAVGAVSGELQLALALALITSLSANVLLVVVLTRHIRGRRRHRDARHARPKAFAVEGELGSILITSADLEAWWANMLAVAGERVGPDARAYVEAIHVDTPFIVFRGESPNAMKAFSGTVAGPDPSHVSWYGVHKIDQLRVSPPSPPLWRTDDSWMDLVKRAWLRERPVRSGAVLYERSAAGRRFWLLNFGPYATDDERLVTGRSYRLEGKELVRHPPA